MTVGTLMAAWAMLAGKASVLYTFYPPLKAHPLFYLGAALFIVGSWIPLFSWANMYMRWKKENPETKTPLAVLGTLVNFTVWFVCTLAVAYEVLVLLLPWAMGWTATVNVTLARTFSGFSGMHWFISGYCLHISCIIRCCRNWREGNYIQILPDAFLFSFSFAFCSGRCASPVQ